MRQETGDLVLSDLYNNIEIFQNCIIQNFWNVQTGFVVQICNCCLQVRHVFIIQKSFIKPRTYEPACLQAGCFLEGLESEHL
jgi:hypothetical protein